MATASASSASFVHQRHHHIATPSTTSSSSCQRPYCLDRSLPLPPPVPPRSYTPPPASEQHVENIYEEITDDFILTALQRNNNNNVTMPTKKVVPNKEDDYGFVCKNSQSSNNSIQRNKRRVAKNLRGILSITDLTNAAAVDDVLAIPPDAKYDLDSCAGLHHSAEPPPLPPPMNNKSSVSMDESRVGFLLGCVKQPASPLTTGYIHEQSETADSQTRPPPSYSESQQIVPNFLPHCHPLTSSTSQNLLPHCVSSSSTASQPLSSSAQNTHQGANLPQTQLNPSHRSLSQLELHQLTCPSVHSGQSSSQPVQNVHRAQYSQPVRAPPSYPTYPAANANPPLPPNHPTQPLHNQAQSVHVPNGHHNSNPNPQPFTHPYQSFLNSTSSDSELSSFPYGSRPSSTLFPQSRSSYSDSVTPYSAGSDSGISVCSERGNFPFSPSGYGVGQFHQDYMYSLYEAHLSSNGTDNGYSQGASSLNTSLAESKTSEYLMPNCVHGTDEGFSELHCCHLQQLQKHKQQLQQQQQSQEHEIRVHYHQQQLHKERLHQHQQQLHQQQLLQQHHHQQQQHNEYSQQQQLTQQEQQQQMESNFVRRAREKIYQKLKHLDLAHPDYNQLEFSPVPWSPPPSECSTDPNLANRPLPPLPPHEQPQVFKSISLSKGLQCLDTRVLSPSVELPPPLPGRSRRLHVSRKPLPMVPQEEDEDNEREEVFEEMKPVEYKGEDIVEGIDNLQVFHRQQGARRVIPRAHSTDTESEYGSRANSRDTRSASRAKSTEKRSIRKARAKSLDKRANGSNKHKEKRAVSVERQQTNPPPPPLKARAIKTIAKTARPPPIIARTISETSSVYSGEDRSPGIVNGTLSDLLRRNHDRQLLV